MPKTGGSSKYRGIPKADWPKIRSGEMVNPNDAQAKEAPEVATAASVGSGSAGASTASFSAPPAAITLNTSGMDSIPANLFNGNNQKLILYSRGGDPKDPVPGFRTYWFNDVENRIAQAQASGWEFVSKDEVMMGMELGPSNKDLGSHVRYVVGTLRSGDPMYAYAMKKPKWLDDAHMREREEKVNMRIENALRQGRVSQNAEDRQVPGGSPGWNAPPISIASKTYR